MYHPTQYTLTKTYINRHIQPINFKELNERILASADRLVNDGNIEASSFTPKRYYERNVEYTLNKRKRWELFDVIKQGISQRVVEVKENEELDHKELEEEEFGLRLVVRNLQPLYQNYYGPCVRIPDAVEYYDSRYSC